MRKIALFTVLCLSVLIVWSTCDVKSASAGYIPDVLPSDQPMRTLTDESYPDWIHEALVDYNQWRNTLDWNPLVQKIAIGKLSYRTDSSWTGFDGGYWWYMTTNTAGDVYIFVRACPPLLEQLRKYESGFHGIQVVGEGSDYYTILTKVNLMQMPFWAWQGTGEYWLEVNKLIDLIHEQLPFIIHMDVVRYFPLK